MQSLRLCALSIALLASGCASSPPLTQDQLNAELQQAPPGTAALMDYPSLTERETMSQLSAWAYTVRRKVEGNWTMPASVPRSLRATVKVTVESDGRLTFVEITTSSGNPDYDSTLLQALKQSTPLPRYPSVQVYNYIQNSGGLSLTFVR